LSNSAWITEIALSLLLLFRRIWHLAVVFGIFTVFIIEFIAREFIFCVLMVSLLFLFTVRTLTGDCYLSISFSWHTSLRSG